MGDGDENFNYDFKDGTGNDILSYNKVNTYNVLNNHLHGMYSGTIHSFDPKSKLLMEIPSQFEQQFKIQDSGKKKGQYKNPNIHFALSPSFRFMGENIKIPPDGGVVGQDMAPVDADIPQDGITEAHGSAYPLIITIPSPLVKGYMSGHSVSYATERNKFNREQRSY